MYAMYSLCGSPSASASQADTECSLSASLILLKLQVPTTRGVETICDLWLISETVQVAYVYTVSQKIRH